MPAAKQVAEPIDWVARIATVAVPLTQRRPSHGQSLPGIDLKPNARQAVSRLVAM